ncbi:hypothetical protein RYX36_017400, partial [Vicia faba]
ETEFFPKETLGTGNENEILGGTVSGTHGLELWLLEIYMEIAMLKQMLMKVVKQEEIDHKVMMMILWKFLCLVK